MTNILLNENGKPMLINNKLVIAGSSNKFVKFSNKIAKTANNKLIRNVKLDRLPSEYQEVEYIQSSGTQWIDTGYVPSYYTEFEADLMYTGTLDTNGTGIFGCRSANTSKSYVMEGWSSSYWNIPAGNFAFGTGTGSGETPIRQIKHNAYLIANQIGRAHV